MNFDQKDRSPEKDDYNALPEEEDKDDMPPIKENVMMDLMTSSPILNRWKMKENIKEMNLDQ